MQKISAYSSRKVYAVAVALCIALSMFIFCMSHEPAIVSAERSGGIADIVAPLFVKNFETLGHDERLEVLSDVDHIIRKIAHFCMYATLGAFFTFASLYHKRAWLMHTLLPVAFGALYAASDEFHQSFIPGRGPLFTDVILDSCGVLAGTVFVLACAYALIKHQSKSLK
ncbi:MAG: VanZ family protein [Clostridia bacterium]|nr:VanZ family protein [Clostridia bacterium]